MVMDSRTGTIERSTGTPDLSAYVCEACNSPVRFDMETAAFFHDLGPDHRWLETEARSVKPAGGGRIMSRFHGKHGEGFMKEVRKAKREEAKKRNSQTLHDRTRKHRLGKCNCE